MNNDNYAIVITSKHNNHSNTYYFNDYLECLSAFDWFIFHYGNKFTVTIIDLTGITDC